MGWKSFMKKDKKTVQNFKEIMIGSSSQLPSDVCRIKHRYFHYRVASLCTIGSLIVWRFRVLAGHWVMMFQRQYSPRQAELQDSFLPEIGSIVSAACLAHDLGNPPFGHSGEKAISTFFSEGKGQFLKEQLLPVEWDDLTHFEGNANAFRLLTHQFEGRRKGGFAMTYSTLASIVKYPFSSSLAG